MKNPLKRPPIGVNKKITWSDPPLVAEKKNHLKWPPIGGGKKNDLKKDHLNWSPLGWNDWPSIMKRKWLKLPDWTSKKFT
jgi:hypothetical protein